MRLPLQLGRASLNQGARFAACVWLGPLLLILAAMLMDSWGAVAAFVFGIPAIFFGGSAILAADLARSDRASDIVLDDSGFVIEGGPLDKTRCRWSEVRGCEIVNGEPRLALRWLLLSWLTARRSPSINKLARVPVEQLSHVTWDCERGCTIELDGTQVTPKSDTDTHLRIEHGVLKPAAP